MFSRYNYIVFFIFFSLLFFSCSKSKKTEAETYFTIETIKNEISDKDKDSLWTDEIEPDLLKYRLYFSDYSVAQEINIDNYEYFIIKPSYKKEVYPELMDFGSLDNSNTPVEIENRVTEILKIIMSDPYADDTVFFEKDYMFNYVFFIDELKKKYKENFGIPFPFELQKNESVEENKLLFESYYLGTFFISDDLIQIPVRFFVGKEFVDVNLYLKPSSNNVYNISIVKWSRINGK